MNSTGKYNASIFICILRIQHHNGIVYGFTFKEGQPVLGRVAQLIGALTHTPKG